MQPFSHPTQEQHHPETDSSPARGYSRCIGSRSQRGKLENIRWLALPNHDVAIRCMAAMCARQGSNHKHTEHTVRRKIGNGTRRVLATTLRCADFSSIGESERGKTKEREQLPACWDLTCRLGAPGKPDLPRAPISWVSLMSTIDSFYPQEMCHQAWYCTLLRAYRGRAL